MVKINFNFGFVFQVPATQVVLEKRPLSGCSVVVLRFATFAFQIWPLLVSSVFITAPVLTVTQLPTKTYVKVKTDSELLKNQQDSHAFTIFGHQAS